MATATPLFARCRRTPRDRSPLSSLGGLIVALIGLVIASTGAAGRVAADDADAASGQDGPSYRVSQFVIQYVKDHPEHPPLDAWLPVDVSLGVRDARYTAPVSGQATETVSIDQRAGALRVYHASALATVCQRLVGALQDRGLIGLYITTHPADIDPATEEDLRRPGDSVLRLIVSTGQLRRIRTIALGHLAKGGSRIDNRIHRQIRERSPLQPLEDARDDTSDLLRQGVLEEYLHYLNRHPGRYVEAALAPGPDGLGVDLDFRINESRPWQVFIQSSNTGTTSTSRWQNRIGFVHRQFTNRDDILTLDYMNAGVDKVHVVNLSYEAPWFATKRPRWWKKSGREPSWIRWFDRDRMPWWGVERLRWRIEGSFSQFEARGLQGPIAGSFEGYGFDSTGWSASGSLIYNFFQRGNFFADIVAGLRLRGIEAVNQQTQRISNPLLVLPSISLRLERRQELSTFFVDLGFEANVLAVDDAQNLGRPGADDKWKLLLWNAVASHYLEPLLFPAAWRDPSTPASSTLAHELYFSLRGQYAFGDRLISQTTQVVGGLFSVRGYPQSIAAGDDVIIGSLEYRFHLPNILPIRHSPIQLPVLGSFRWTRQQPYGRADWDLVLRLFVDAAHTRQNLPSNSFGVADPSQFLAGAGIGAEFSFKSYLRARVDYGWALRDSKATAPSDRVRAGNNQIYFHFSLFY